MLGRDLEFSMNEENPSKWERAGCYGINEQGEAVTSEGGVVMGLVHSVGMMAGMVGNGFVGQRRKAFKAGERAW